MYQLYLLRYRGTATVPWVGTYGTYEVGEYTHTGVGPTGPSFWSPQKRYKVFWTSVGWLLQWPRRSQAGCDRDAGE